MSTLSGNGKNGSSDGETTPRDEPVIGEVPGEILELAENLRQYVDRALKVELDYDAETLPVLDAYLKVVAGGVSDRPELEPLVARAAAAYFGEVVRRRIDGFWRLRPDPNDEWHICSRRALLSLSPLGMVLDAMAKGASPDGPSPELRLSPPDQALAEERLARFPPVPEDEYYLLSTRTEVIEVVYETLREQMKAEGRESTVFEAEDYDEE